MWIGWKTVSLGVVTGAAIAVALFSSLAPGAAPVTASIPVSDVNPSVVFADCTPPAELENGECVTHLTVTRTVTPAPAPAASASSSSSSTSSRPAPAASPSHDDHDDDDGDDDDHDDDEGDHEGDDD